MLTRGALDKVFQMYWDDMGRCRAGGAYWSLLHVTVCLPDICAALESDNGKTNGERYINWCGDYLRDVMLTGEERYWMRCKVLHEGRAQTGRPGRYTGFAFTQPAATGDVDHRRVDGTTLVLDVGKLSAEYERGVRDWIRIVEAGPANQIAPNVAKNLQTVVRVRPALLPTKVPGVVTSSYRTS
jgi:hypothetical protein